MALFIWKSVSCLTHLLFIAERKTVLLLFSLFFLTNYTHAQVDALLFKKLTVEEGLSQNTISSIYQDTQGFIWIGTDDGLNRYDGYDIKVYRRNDADKYSLTGNWITWMIEDAEGDLWILTYDGLNKYDRQNDRFFRYYYDKNDLTSIPDNRLVRSFIDSRNQIWFSTANGFCKYEKRKDKFTRFRNNTRFTKDNKENLFVHFVEDKNNNLWVTSFAGVSCIKLTNNSITHYSIGKTDNSDTYSILCDTDGDIWVTTAADGLHKYEPSKNTFVQFLKPNLVKGFVVNSYTKVIQDKYNRLWVGTSLGIVRIDKKTGKSFFYKGKDAPIFCNDLLFENELLYIATNYGLYTLEPSTGKFTSYKKNELDPCGLSENQLNGFNKDRNGEIWIRTNRKGINKIVDPVFRKITGRTKGLNSKIIYDIYEDKEGDIWFATLQDGLNRWDPKTGEMEYYTHDKTKPYSIQSNFLNIIYQDSYSMYWIGSRDAGVRTFDPKTNRFLPLLYTTNSLEKYATRSFFEDSERTFWIGTRGGGLNKYDRGNKKFVEYQFGEKANLFNQIIVMFEDRDKNFWIGTDEGLLLFNRKDGSYFNQKFEMQNSKVYSGNSIFDIYEDNKGFLWLTTYGGGLIRYEKKNRTYKIYTEADGLINNYVYNITVDDSGYFWLNTHKGLSRFDPVNGKFLNFTKEDGLPSNEMNADGALKTKDGYIIFGTANGAVSFNPRKLNVERKYIPLVLTSFKKLNDETKLTPDITTAGKLELSYNDYLFSIQYAALEFDEPGKINYAYKMDGFDKNWNFVGKRREAIYTNLEPGKYLFKVTLVNRFGELQSEPKTLQIFISPPYWRTWWFRSLVIMVVIVFFYLIYRWRITQVQRVEKAKADERIRAIENEKLLKEQLSRDLHDEINSELTAVINNCNLLTSHKNLDASINDKLGTISSLSERLRDMIKDVVWFIKPDNEKNEKLLAKLYTTAKELLCAIDYEIEIDERIFDTLILSVNEKKHLYLIFKESLQNIVTHTAATAVNITLKSEEKELLLEITDNGAGFDLNTVKPGNGLSNLKERAKILGAKLTIESKLGDGTRIELIYPLRGGNSK